MDGVSVAGKEYISSRRAAELCGYAQDYVGQLARSGQIDAQRISGLWYVFLESLQSYKTNAEISKPVPHAFKSEDKGEAAIELDGKKYVSASQAAKLTQYNQDYIGQLARGGKITSRQVGNRWYIDADALLAHKKEKDALLAAVQVESVGLKKSQPITPALSTPSPVQINTYKKPEAALLSYSQDTRALLPVMKESPPEPPVQEEMPVREMTIIRNSNSIPIRVLDHSPQTLTLSPIQEYKPLAAHRRAARGKNKPVAIAALTFVLVLSAGLVALKGNAIYATLTHTGNAGNSSDATAASAAAFDKLGDVLDALLNPEIVYERRN